MEKAFLLKGCEETQPGRDLAEDVMSYAQRMENFASEHGVTIKTKYDPEKEDGTLEIRCLRNDNGNEVAASAILISIMSAAMILGARRTVDDDWKEIMEEAWQIIADNAEDAGRVMADMAGMQIELADQIRVKEARGQVEQMVPFREKKTDVAQPVTQ